MNTFINPKLQAVAQKFVDGDRSQWDLLETMATELADDAAHAILTAMSADPTTTRMAPAPSVTGMAVALGGLAAAANHTMGRRDPSMMFALIWKMITHGYNEWWANERDAS